MILKHLLTPSGWLLRSSDPRWGCYNNVCGAYDHDCGRHIDDWGSDGDWSYLDAHSGRSSGHHRQCHLDWCDDQGICSGDGNRCQLRDAEIRGGGNKRMLSPIVFFDSFSFTYCLSFSFQKKIKLIWHCFVKPVSTAVSQVQVARRLQARKLQVQLTAIFEVALPSSAAAQETLEAIEAISVEETNSAITNAVVAQGFQGNIEVTGKEATTQEKVGADRGVGDGAASPLAILPLSLALLIHWCWVLLFLGAAHLFASISWPWFAGKLPAK